MPVGWTFASLILSDVAAAATGSFPEADRKSAAGEARSAVPAGHHEDVAKAAEEALADGKSPWRPPSVP